MTPLRLVFFFAALLCSLAPPVHADDQQTATADCWTAPSFDCLVAEAIAVVAKGDDERFYEDIVSMQVGVGDIEGALSTVDRMDPDSGAWALAEITGAQADAGDIKGAIQTSSRISIVTVRDSALVHVVRAHAKAGEIDAVVKTVKMFGDITISERITAVIEAARFYVSDRGDDHDLRIRGQFLLEARETIVKAHPLFLTSVTRGALMSKAVDVERELFGLEAARRRIPELMAIARKSDGQLNPLLATARVLATLRDYKSLDDCLALIGSENEFVLALVLVAIHQAKIQDFDGARKSIKKLPGDGSGTATDTVDLSISISLANAGNISEAIKIARGIRVSALAIEAYAGIAAAQFKAGDRAGAERSIRRAMSLAATNKNLYQRAYGYSDIADAFAGAGDRKRTGEIVVRALALAKKFDALFQVELLMRAAAALSKFRR